MLFAYWSHDIGGHMPGKIEPELYTRWVQYGIYSPVFRTHATKDAEAERRIWAYADPYSGVMKQAVQTRYERVPYIYTENRKGVDNGLSLCRPLYHEWPQAKEAYTAPGQYLFGSRMIVAPVTQSADPATGLAAVSVWLPPGEWIDTATDQSLDGDSRVSRSYLLAEIPVFVRPGAVIPGQFGARRLNDRSYSNLLVDTWPGGEDTYLLYEDDGISQGYLTGKEAWIVLSKGEEKNLQTVEIKLAGGSYKGMLFKKSLELRIHASPPPSLVYVGRRALSWSYRLGREGWTYDGNTATVIVRLPLIDISKGVRIRVQRQSKPSAIYGLAGLFRRLDLVRSYVNLCGSLEPLHEEQSLPVRLAQTGFRISRHPERFQEELAALKQELERLSAVLAAMEEKSLELGGGWMKPEYLSRARAVWDCTQRGFRNTLVSL